MPGVIMDQANFGGARWEPDADDFRYGPSLANASESSAGSSNTKMDSIQVNGTAGSTDMLNPDPKAAGVGSDRLGPPPELAHITQGFFPFTQLVNRSVQQCWNDLSDVITELAEIQVPPQGQPTPAAPVNGKSPGNQSAENVHKKLRVLDFAHGRRSDFIKLLVLSQWSRQAADVSKLIDIQGFVRSRHQAYAGALQSLGDMKRDLVMAQVANPDLKTALEVLTKGKVVAMPDLGYKPPKPLTVKTTLKKLQKLNRVISVRLALHDQLPRPFQSYRVRNGRATFYVPGEFELDLSVGNEDRSSQFFFVDIRFLFSPSSPIPKGWILNELDMKVNNVLRDRGLAGCFDFLHNLVLTNKLQTFFKQAITLARGAWSEGLRVELLHRTLVLQYWAPRSGPKSWIEIGVKRGRRGGQGRDVPHLGLRWMRDGQEVDSGDIRFETESISTESVLRSVIALHISHRLSSAYAKLSESLLFSTGELSLQTQLSAMEPANCELNAQLTFSRRLCVSVEPMSGTAILSAIPNALERPEGDRNPDKTSADDIVSRVSRLRCAAAVEEVESNMKILGFETVNPRGLRLDARKMFPSNVLRFSFFWHRNWDRNWILAAASSMDSDNWWLVQLRAAAPSRPDIRTNVPFDPGSNLTSVIRSAQAISSTFHPAQQHQTYASFADLGHCISGILAIHANARYLLELQCVAFRPQLQRIQVESGLQVPDLFIHYEPANLPPPLRVALPGGLKKKSFIKDTVRLAFHGIDAHTGTAIMVAYGNLLIPVKAFGTLIPKCEDRSLVFQQKGSGFALRLLAPSGRCVIGDLIKTLQRLECVLSIIESLQQRKMPPRSLSLSQIAFGYNPETNLSAVIHIKDSEALSKQSIDPAEITSTTGRLLVLRLSISFDRSTPHRRVQESLTPILNDSSDGGFDSAMEILSLTLPLLRALDGITANPTRKEPLKAQVIVRDAKSFRIHYPAHRYRFQIIAGQHLNRMAWILRDVSGAQDRSNQAQLTTKLKDGLYNSKGDGWRGLGNGVVAEADKVGNLLSELDNCFDIVQPIPGAALVPGQRKPQKPADITKAIPANNTAHPASGVAPTPPPPPPHDAKPLAAPTNEPPSKNLEPIVIE